MDKNYETSIHRTGRIGVIIAIGFMLGIPAVISTVYGVWPESIGQIFAVGGGLLAVFLPTNIAEVLSYTPILGSSAYLTFLTGNVMNLKIPVVINAQVLTDTSQGTDEGDTIATSGFLHCYHTDYCAGSHSSGTAPPAAYESGGSDGDSVPASCTVRRNSLKLCQ